MAHAGRARESASGADGAGAGASSGVGIAGIQIAKLFQLPRDHHRRRRIENWKKPAPSALTTASSTISGKFPKKIRRITNKEGVDIVLEHVGAATWTKA